MARKQTTFQDDTVAIQAAINAANANTYAEVDTDILRRRIALDQLDGWFGMGRQAEAYRFWRAIPEAGTIAESEALAGAR